MNVCNLASGVNTLIPDLSGANVVGAKCRVVDLNTNVSFRFIVSLVGSYCHAHSHVQTDETEDNSMVASIPEQKER